MPTLREGDRISNYLLEARIGAGSFGEVWRARHHVFAEKVAIKVPTDPQYVRNLQREGVVVHGLKHPNIVRAIDLDPFADPPYFIMELVDGPSLRAAIDRYKNTFPVHAALAIIRGTLQALSAAHAGGLVHRDIKPANILLNHPLESLASIAEPAVKVTDFGLGHAGGTTVQSMMQSGSLLTEEGRSVSGTIAYMSPEQKEGRELDGRSDLYSCGIVLFEMLTGERPQGGEAPSALRREVPEWIDEVFLRCYARLDRRYSKAEEVLEVLARGGERGRPVERQTAPWVPVGGDLRCPVCRGAVERADQYCIHCGKQLSASVPRCRGCGAFVSANDRFCILCGRDLRVLAG